MSNSKEISIKESEELVLSFLHSLHWISYLRTGSTLINDEISINLLIKLLPIKNCNGIDVVAYKELNENTAFDGLLRYKTELKKSLNKCESNGWKKNYLFALIA